MGLVPTANLSTAGGALAMPDERDSTTGSKLLFAIPGKQHGSGSVHLAWRRDGQYIATCGNNRSVHVYDRYGNVVDDILLTAGGLVGMLDWDAEGECLAILQQGNSAIAIWDAVNRKNLSVETNTKDLCWIRWSNSNELAAGSAKGNLIIYNKRTTRISNLLGKHTKRIITGAWTLSNQLVLISEDKSLSVNASNGDLVKQITLSAEPSAMILPELASNRAGTGGIASLRMGSKMIVHVNLGEGTIPPKTFTFNAKFGEIVSHKWLRDEYMIVAFSAGYVVGVAPREIPPPGADYKEIFSAQLFKAKIMDLVVCQTMRRAAICAESSVKVIDLAEWREISEDTITMPGSWCEKLRWSDDGNILSVSTTDGTVFNYLARMPVLNASYGTKIVYMSSLREVLVKDAVEDNKRSLNFQIKTEASFLALGKSHFGLGLNNICLFYSLDNRGDQIPHEFEYMSTVQSISMNQQMAAVLFDGRVQLHMVSGDPDGRHTLIFPDPTEPNGITTSHLTEDFLIYGTSTGMIVYYSIEDASKPNEYRHSTGIKHLYPNTTGTRLVVVDSSGSCFVYNPVDLSMMEVKDFPKELETVVWDKSDSRIFVAVCAETMTTFVYTAVSLRGSSITNVGTTNRPGNYSPILLYNGQLTMQTPSGGIVNLTLESHSAVYNQGRRATTPQDQLAQCISLGKLDEAFLHALQADSTESWALLKKCALEALDVKLAVRVGRQMKDSSFVPALENLQQTEDRSLLAGHMAMLLGEYGMAQDLFLSSSRPVAALNMQCDIMHWDQALRLAETLDPQNIPSICLQYAEQLQNQGEHQLALDRYEQAMASTYLAGGKTIQADLRPEHIAACTAGMARMYTKLGNSAKGMQIALNCPPSVSMDCAAILEGMKQFSDAAQLYERCGAYDKAVALYLRLKDPKAAGALMTKITTPKLHISYAQIKEKQSAFKEAADAYERGQDMDSVVRLCLEQLNAPLRACEIIRRTRSCNGAQEIAKYSQGTGDYRTAIEFLLIAKEYDQALEIAQAHDLMDAYALFLGPDGQTAQYARIAGYYESKSQLEQAAKFYDSAGQYGKALKLYLQVGEKALDRAIEVVGSARNEVLTHTLVDYLMGEHDKVPKDPNYIFRLYMALGNYRQAARTAVIIARQEQELGNYKVAHKMLFDTYKDLDSQSIPVSRELDEALSLLHSYVLVKTLVKQGDHEAGARMLVRVAKSISRFPAHVVPILTSTVIECQRAGLKKTAFEYASMLMRPEYRPQIAEAYKKKIESIVRKPSKEQDEPDPVAPCPYCGCKSAATSLDCSQCRSRIPYCVATGLRMVAHDWTLCPSCRFPALYTKFLGVITADKVCPMCDQEIIPSSIVKVENPEEMLRKAAKQVAEAGDPE